ncbi:MAG TPA: hypothetical protein VNH22_05705 [Blastocatellia bacterium]|jgi:hypothetical protein|nr:hypothetical protein [Blastocatellia bacterium]
MLGKDVTEIKLRDYYHHAIEWAGSLKLGRELERIRKDVKTDFEYLKGSLIDKELLSPSAAEASDLNLSILVVDCRERKTPPLPEIPGVKKIEY